MTLAQTICQKMEELLASGGVICGQNLSAVGNVAGTVPDFTPETPGVVEFPTSDVSNAGIAVGMALSGKRVCQIVRYQGFLHFNAWAWSAYAAKARSGYGMACPLLIRALCMEGHIGGTGNAHHGTVMRIPGLKVRAPMTPDEWIACYDEWLAGDAPMFISENRRAFGVDDEDDSVEGLPSRSREFLLLPIGGARLEAVKALSQLRATGLDIDSMPIVRLRPFDAWAHIARANMLSKTTRTRSALVIDGDYDMVARDIAHRLWEASGIPVYAMGLDDRHPGFSTATDNLTPKSDAIVREVLRLVS